MKNILSRYQNNNFVCLLISKPLKILDHFFHFETHYTSRRIKSIVTSLNISSPPTHSVNYAGGTKVYFNASASQTISSSIPTRDNHTFTCSIPYMDETVRISFKAVFNPPPAPLQFLLCNLPEATILESYLPLKQALSTLLYTPLSNINITPLGTSPQDPLPVPTSAVEVSVPNFTSHLLHLASPPADDANPRSHWALLPKSTSPALRGIQMKWKFPKKRCSLCSLHGHAAHQCALAPDVAANLKHDRSNTCHSSYHPPSFSTVPVHTQQRSSSHNPRPSYLSFTPSLSASSTAAALHPPTSVCPPR